MPGTLNIKPDGTPYRRWTSEENTSLVDLAITERSALCPVCLYNVTILVQQLTRRAVTVHLQCENCWNRGGESRDLVE
jgi:hypothetical protein